jgi:transposase-like protein
MHSRPNPSAAIDGVARTVTVEYRVEVREWQNRPLEKMYPVVFFDALRVKIRDQGSVGNKAVYFALGIDADGKKDVLGM